MITYTYLDRKTEIHELVFRQKVAPYELFEKIKSGVIDSEGKKLEWEGEAMVIGIKLDMLRDIWNITLEIVYAVPVFKYFDEVAGRYDYSYDNASPRMSKVQISYPFINNLPQYK
jgi:hypothetical protein